MATTVTMLNDQGAKRTDCQRRKSGTLLFETRRIFAMKIHFINQVGESSGLLGRHLEVVKPLDVVEWMTMRAVFFFHGG